MSEIEKIPQTEIDARFDETIASGVFDVYHIGTDDDPIRFANQCAAFDVLARETDKSIGYENMQSILNRIDGLRNRIFYKFGFLKNIPESLIPEVENKLAGLLEFNQIEYHEPVMATGLLRAVSLSGVSSRELRMNENGAVFGYLYGVRVYLHDDGSYRAGLVIGSAIVDDGGLLAEFPVEDEVVVVPIGKDTGAELYKVIKIDSEPLR
ncbi:MAG: hypothetical protein WBB94_01215 [Candidatus Saccharimonadaceae bacterium]